jgi:DeoR/GlpR family transcriptional regulator of sugar metabolism
VEKLPDNRKERLNNYIQLKGEVKISELEKIFSDVSTMTIRRDLEYLEQQGEVLRVRGGVVSIEHVSKQREEIYTQREAVNLEGKNIIAQKALDFVQGSRSIYIDSGTTMMAFAKLLSDGHYFIVTNGVNIALELARNSNASVNTVGGIINKETLSVSGANSIEFVKNINIDIAFIATSGFSVEDGFTNGYAAECELKREVIQKSKKVILLMDHTKIDQNMLFTFARPQDIHVLITDGSLPEAVRTEFEKHHVEIV